MTRANKVASLDITIGQCVNGVAALLGRNACGQADFIIN